MPQIQQIAEIYASQLFWLVIFFGAIFLFVGYGMVPKIQATVDARDARIAQDLKEAGSARETADKLEEQYRAAMDKSRSEAAHIAAEAKAAGARATEVQVKEADQAAQGRLEEAMARIAQARSSAMNEIETVAAEAAAEMVQRVAGLSVDPTTAKKAVQQELSRG